jgi:cytidylate kinase
MIISSTKDSYSISLNGENVTNRLRDVKVSALVSKISANALIREWMVKKQRKIASQGSIVVEGRDIGTVVFPNADYKFFITASIEIRAKRRLEAENQDRDLSMVIEDIRTRDFHDSSRKVSPLKKAEGSIVIDTTHLSINEQVNMILNKINKT